MKIIHNCFAIKLCLLLFLGIITISCNKKNIIVSFDPMENFPEKKVVNLDFDMQQSVFEGLSLPNKDSMFRFSFTISPKKDKQYYYKIFYQNISYAFADDDTLNKENFYGSWKETSVGFKPVKNKTVVDSFAIVGNPRNELIYFGDSVENYAHQEDIEQIKRDILKDSNWYNQIKQKAEQQNEDLQDMIYKDAIWVLRNNHVKKNNVNLRQRRNPRVGEYEFMIVVVEKDALQKIPDYIKDISKQNNGEFVNPFAYFRLGKGAKTKGVYSLVSERKLKARVKYNLSNGVYLNRLDYQNKDFKVKENNPKVSDDDSLFKYANFEQYFHNINIYDTLNQAQILKDVTSKDFTVNSYDSIAKSTLVKRMATHPYITSIAGSTIKCVNNSIQIINPANKDLSSAKKENVGIRARIGLTYGTYIFKMKFPPILNANGVPNGLTNAAWLIYQSESSWNNRRPSKTGYVKNNYNNNETERIPTTYYSEIDIEMTKTSAYWPCQKNNIPKTYDAKTNNKIVFAATNWDLANNDNSFIFSKKLGREKNNLFFTKQYKGREYYFHRWNTNYRALTSKVEISNDIFLKPYYYYVIKWTPKEIIWYCGEDLNHLQVMSYMNDTYTSIPNNQMVPIITQEYHYTRYWPPVIYAQENIPYSSKDFVGTLYELIVE